MRPAPWASYLLLAAAAVSGQEAQFGFASPATLSFFAGHTHRASAQPGSSVTPAFRAVVYPSLKLGSNWFAYGALQTHSQPYFYD